MLAKIENLQQAANKYALKTFVFYELFVKWQYPPVTVVPFVAGLLKGS